MIGRIEGGIEKYLNKQETPDGRKGAVLQFWGGIDENKPLEESVKKFEAELSFRIRQDILVKPFTALFDALPNPDGKIGIMERVGHCGDGYEWIEQRYGRDHDCCAVDGFRVPDRKRAGLRKGRYGRQLLVYVQNQRGSHGGWTERH